MNNYMFPTTIVDNFFDDPTLIRNFALAQEFFPDPDHKWPGLRTDFLHILDPKFFGNTMQQFLLLFYPAGSECSFSASAQFQLVPKEYDQGWVHLDGALVTGIIYLNDEHIPNSGTTIYRPKYPGTGLIHGDKIEESFKNPDRTADFEKFRKENNDQFEESIVVKNKFNRLVAFDSHLYHAAGDFKTGESDTSRLTLVFFINKLVVDHYPIQRIKRGI